MCLHDDAETKATKTWLDVGIFPFDGRSATNGCSVYKTLCHILLSKAILNSRFYGEHPILHQCPKYPINTQPIQVANDQLKTVKQAIKYYISFGSHTCEIIAHLLPFSNSSTFELKSMTEIEEKSNYSKLVFKFKKRCIDIILTEDLHLLVGKSMAFDCEIVKKPPDTTGGPVIVENKITEKCLFTSNLY